MEEEEMRNKETRRTHCTTQWVGVQETQSGEQYVHRDLLILVEELFISPTHCELEVPYPRQTCTSQAFHYVKGKISQFLII